MPQERAEKRIDELPKFTEIADDAMFPFEQGGIAGYGEARLIKNYNKGENGATFTPSVSASGVLSWTNDGGKQNPASVNLVNAVINALPVYEGEVN